MKFTHETRAQRVVFDAGGAAAAVAAEVSARGATRIMLIASAREAARAGPVAASIPVVLHHDEVVMHVPVEVAERAREAAGRSGADLVVCIGGGSTTGLAKAVALTTGLPIVAVPTTYAGSETTNVWGMTEGGVKTTGVSNDVLPASIVYDATLLASLPAELAVASGLNALAHCIDSMWAPRSDPIDRVLAAEGIRLLADGLPVVAADPGRTSGIEDMLLGSYLAGVAFSSAGSGLHHKICHVVAGMFDLPHAQTHAVVLPHVLAFNAPNAPEAEHRISAAFGAATASSGLAALRTDLDAPKALRDYGMPEEGIARAVPLVMAAAPAGNPTPVTEANIEALLTRAWAGQSG